MNEAYEKIEQDLLAECERRVGTSFNEGVAHIIDHSELHEWLIYFRGRELLDNPVLFEQYKQFAVDKCANYIQSAFEHPEDVFDAIGGYIANKYPHILGKSDSFKRITEAEYDELDGGDYQICRIYPAEKGQFTVEDINFGRCGFGNFKAAFEGAQKFGNTHYVPYPAVDFENKEIMVPFYQSQVRRLCGCITEVTTETPLEIDQINQLHKTPCHECKNEYV